MRLNFHFGKTLLDIVDARVCARMRIYIKRIFNLIRLFQFRSDHVRFIRYIKVNALLKVASTYNKYQVSNQQQ